jgi:hypothetical protein
MSSKSISINDILRDIKIFKNEEKNKREYLNNEIDNWKKLLLSERGTKEKYHKLLLSEKKTKEEYQGYYKQECFKVCELEKKLRDIYKTLSPKEDIMDCRSLPTDDEEKYTEILPLINKIKNENDKLKEGTDSIFSSIRRELHSPEELIYDNEEDTEINDFIYDGVKYFNEKTLESKVFDEDGDHVGYLQRDKIEFINSGWAKCHEKMKTHLMGK